MHAHKSERLGFDISYKYQADVYAVGMEYINAFDKCMKGGTQLSSEQWAKRANILRCELYNMLIKNAPVLETHRLRVDGDDGDIDKLRAVVKSIEPV